MKIKLRFIFMFLCLFFGSSHLISKELNFDWTLKINNQLLLRGKMTTSNQVSRNPLLTGCNSESSELSCFSCSCLYCSGKEYSIYKVKSSISISFFQNNQNPSISLPFPTLLGNGETNLHHDFITNYMLRGQVTTAAENIISHFCCIFCCCLYVAYEFSSEGTRHKREVELIDSLEQATPTDLPDHVVVYKRYLQHINTSSDYQTGNSKNIITEGNVQIFNLFLDSPEIQQWLTNNLNSEINLRQSIIVPELFSIASSAYLTTEVNNDRYSDENVTASHFLILQISNGITIRYHLSQNDDNTIHILGIVITQNDSVLTFNTNSYDTIQNEPPPLYENVATVECKCNGACNCANSNSNHTRTQGLRTSREPHNLKVKNEFFSY